MINPVFNAASVFVGFYECLPISIRALISLSIGSFCLVSVIETLFSHLR